MLAGLCRAARVSSPLLSHSLSSPSSSPHLKAVQVSLVSSLHNCFRSSSTQHHHHHNVNVSKLTECYRDIIAASGEDISREGLVKTPVRAAKAFAYFVKGYGEKVEDIKMEADVTNGAIFHEESKDLVLVKDINFCSLCEHHLVPFFGKVHIAYIPNGKVIGLSKLSRIADVFSRRLQLQERLTREISTSISKILDAQGVAVSIEATHLCMTLRGVQQTNAVTVTNSFVGVFERDPDLRNRYLHMIRPSARF